MCEREEQICASLWVGFLYTYKAMTLQYGINRSKCIKDDEIPCENFSILVEKAKKYFKNIVQTECNVLRHLTECYLHSENAL